ncbi:MAG: ATP synthase F1 subunit epsilon [Candidatus Aminicenantales bacterium]
MSQSVRPLIHLRVITPQSLAADAEVEEVTIPSLDGELGILPGHRPLYTALGSGRLTYKASGRWESLSVRGGYAEVGPERVTVFAELSDDEQTRR